MQEVRVAVRVNVRGKTRGFVLVSKNSNINTNFVWYCNLETLESGSDIPGKVLKYVTGDGCRRSVGPIT